MWIKSEPEKERVLFEKGILPIGTYVMALMAWLWAIEQESSKSPYTSLVWLVVLSVLAYEVGFKSFFSRGRNTYFNLVFIIPIVVCFFGVVGGYVFGIA